MEPLSFAVGAGAAAAAALGLGAGLRLHHRLQRVEGNLARLRNELAAERHAADHDPLTGLPNRRAFQRRGSALLADPGHPATACAVIDLDSFKEVNDTLGHSAGDQVLVTLAGRLARLTNEQDLVARLGGDEFAALLTDGRGGPADPDRPAVCRPDRLGAHLADVLGAPMVVNGRWLRVTAAVGVTPVRPGAALNDLLHTADLAMYRHKARSTQPAALVTSPARGITGQPVTAPSTPLLQAPAR
ncbi:GGDEF domain-containing protein [Natronosporangium hydrolyticum]|uniref:GGDEF domain-containing protein n=1 Tax=Natronosporangium hydrolyticum TaxID=2811111 RepID=UPI001EFA2428|nr:GGDEF domain-containing protein [Natronosporangium hydrolyticum]